MHIKIILTIILLLELFINNSVLGSSSFDRFVIKSESTMIIKLLQKEKVHNTVSCFKITAEILESTNATSKTITFWSNNEVDFVDDVKFYLVVLFSASDNTVKTCGDSKNFLYVQSRVQSMFALTDRRFCSLEKMCELIITRQSIFGNNNGNSTIVEYIFEHDRILAIASIVNLKKTFLKK